MKLSTALIALGAAALAAGASAQTLRPGLWEVTNHMRTGSGDMEKAMAQAREQLAAMPPEQRKMMEEMLAKHGLKMGAGGPATISTKICMTREMAERGHMPAQQGDCKTTSQQRSGNTLKFAFTCTNPPATGAGVYTIVKPEAYTVKMTINSTVEGKPETMNMDGSGKWLSADCGNVKPLPMK
jgi:hypothetical protein